MGLRWEYKVVERAEPATVVWLNALGEEGWEVCAIEPRYDPLLGSVQAQYGRLWLFKRMVLEHPAVQAESADVTYQDYPSPVPTPVEVTMPDFKQATVEKPKRKWSAEAKERARQRMVMLEATTSPQEETDAPSGETTTDGAR